VRNSSDPIAAAAEWVGRIAAVAFEMVLPGLAGKWLDERWGSGPWLMIVGFALGMTAAMYHLLAMTAADNKKRNKNGKSDERNER
jgi:F0F1-type ATP synthase assembly protein I